MEQYILKSQKTMDFFFFFFALMGKQETRDGFGNEKECSVS